MEVLTPAQKKRKDKKQVRNGKKGRAGKIEFYSKGEIRGKGELTGERTNPQRGGGRSLGRGVGDRKFNEEYGNPCKPKPR